MAAQAASQSALEPVGYEAERLAALFWWMAGGGACVWFLLAVLVAYAVRSGAGPAAQRAFIIWGGAVFPTVTLAGLLAYGLPLLGELTLPAPAGALRIEVTGEQWWWRVRYPTERGAAVELANEIRLPVGRPAVFELRSADVIHSFWIPSLAGKRDMFPGRTTRLVVHPTKTGRYRGVCAEYCGSSHAFMAFEALVVEPHEFEAWLERQRAPALPPGPVAARGRALFSAAGCAGCHAVRGTAAAGSIGPDLTHVGARLSVAAGALPPGARSLSRWLERAHEVKPDSRMPHFGMLPEDERAALAEYLASLR